MLLVSGSKDNTVRLWDCSNGGQLLATGKGHISAVSAVAFGSQKSRFLVTGGADKLLKVEAPASLSLSPFDLYPMLLEPTWNHCAAQVWDIAAFTEQAQGHDGSNAKQAVSLRAIGAVAAHDKVW